MKALITFFLIVGIIGCDKSTQGEPGKTGAVGPTGNQGIQGMTGPQGSQGTAGSPGQDATPVTAIQLCPNVAPVYPSTFPEWVLCIDNQLYGVYSDHGGFWALLPPGTYTSDGINASCTVVIGEGCQVSQ